MAINKQLANTQDLVEIEEIKEGTVILKNGSFRQVVMVSGANTALMAESELDILSSGYRSFLNGLDFPIQIIIHSRKVNIERYLGSLEKRREQEPSALLQSQIGEYGQFVSGFVKENAIMEKSFLVVIPYFPVKLPGKETVGGMAKLWPFSKKESKSETTEKKNQTEDLEFRESLNQINQRTAQIVQGLETIGLEAITLSNEELIELFYNFYNPETVEKEMKSIPTKT
ncbi:MAG: hypothetical protein HY093_04580 [Candidatus Liptonbacteria bacterium]|nr:hypothetical protein [Candidatus Liptonbacteria bacterium]